MNNQVKGRISVAGKQFNMTNDHGIGLIELEGMLTLVTFNCPFETFPPQGSGTIIGQTNIALTIMNGQLMYGDQVVHTEVK